MSNNKFKIGDKVKFVNNKDIYTDSDITNPVLHRIYTVRGFSKKGGLLLKEVINDDNMFWPLDNIVGEPGFATWRFVKELSSEVKAQNKSKKKVSIKIPNEVVESLDLQSVSLN